MPPRPSLAALARPAGVFAMVALDQRESLRTMFADSGRRAEDEDLVEFKVAVAERLAPIASAMLFDRDFGMRAFRAAAASPSCGRILAADALVQERGAPVEATAIDGDVDPAAAAGEGAVALKLLILWRGAENADACVAMAAEFVQRCHAGGLLAVVEPVVREPSGRRGATTDATWDREAAILDAARAIGSGSVPDLYKCEVPFHGRGGEAETIAICEEITRTLPVPWVVLSQGVAIDDFPRAVELACRGGASGFLAGRAVWSDAVREPDYRARLEAVSVPRLRGLVETVDRLGRPWTRAQA